MTSPAAKGHGHAVARGDGGVGGLLEEPAQPARGDEHGPREDGDRAGCRSRPGARRPCSPPPPMMRPHASVVGEDRGCVPGPRRFLGERPLELLARGVPVGVEDALLAVGRLPREVKLAVLPVEPGTPFDELENRPGALLHEHADGGLSAEPVPGFERVLQVLFGRVALGERRGDAALGVLGVGFPQAVLRGDEDAPARVRPPRWHPEARRCPSRARGGRRRAVSSEIIRAALRTRRLESRSEGPCSQAPPVANPMELLLQGGNVDPFGAGTLLAQSASTAVDSDRPAPQRKGRGLSPPALDCFIRLLVRLLRLVGVDLGEELIGHGGDLVLAVALGAVGLGRE